MPANLSPEPDPEWSFYDQAYYIGKCTPIYLYSIHTAEINKVASNKRGINTQ